jgi:chromosome segregation ATPase
MSDYNITLFEACEQLSRSKKSISRYVRKGLLNPKKVKSQQGTLEYRFSESELKAFKEKETESRQDRQDTQDRTDETPDIKKIIAETAENKESVLDKSETDETGHGRQDGTEQTGQQEAKEITDTIKKKEKILDKGQTEQTGQDGEVITLLKETTGLLRDQLKVKDEQIKDLGGKIDQLIERDRETNILLKGLQEKVLMLEQPKPDQTGQDKENKKSFFKSLFNGKL